jgi:aminopeptidase-like protein
MKNLKKNNDISKKYYFFAKNELQTIYRSLTGRGNYQTLKLIKKKFTGLKIKYFNSGDKVFDWTVPQEWNVNDAYILDKYNKKIIDFKKNFLHLVGYSKKIDKVVSKNELLKLLIIHKKISNAVPYITAYYKKNFFGFCCSSIQKKNIKKKYDKDDNFKLHIDSNFKKKGKMHYGELVIKGKSKEEILISTYICHPQMANNELSGPIVSMSLIEYFLKQSKKKILSKTLRFIFIPETIGSISYLSRNIGILKKNVVAGFNLSCIGDERMYSCMLSRDQNTISDRALLETFKKLNIKPKIYSFLKRGSDERQYNFPKVDLPIASIFRSKYGEYKEYHTSLDDFNLVTPRGIKGGYTVAREAINFILSSTYPKCKIICEPNMGKRGLYPLVSKDAKDNKLMNMMNFITYADGKIELKELSKKIKIKESEAKNIFRFLQKQRIIDS